MVFYRRQYLRDRDRGRGRRMGIVVRVDRGSAEKVESTMKPGRLGAGRLVMVG